MMRTYPEGNLPVGVISRPLPAVMANSIALDHNLGKLFIVATD